VSAELAPHPVTRLEVSGIRKQFPGIVALDASRSGCVLLISSDMPEVIRLSDRILVMRNHALVGEMSNTHEYDEISEAIMAH